MKKKFFKVISLFLSVLVISTLFLSVFSMSVSAEEIPLQFQITAYETNDVDAVGGKRVYDSGMQTFGIATTDYISVEGASATYLNYHIQLGNDETRTLFSSGKKYNVIFDGIVCYPLMDADEYGNPSPDYNMTYIYYTRINGTTSSGYYKYDQIKFYNNGDSTFRMEVTLEITEDNPGVSTMLFGVQDTIPNGRYQVGYVNPTISINEIGYFDSIFLEIKSYIENIVNKNTFISSVLSSVKNTLDTVSSNIASLSSSIVSGIANSSVFKTILEYTQGISKKVQAIYDGFSSRMQNIYDSMNTRLVNIYELMWNRFKSLIDTLSGLATNFYNFSTDIKTKFLDGVGDLFENVKSLANDIVSGNLVQNIKDFIFSTFNIPTLDDIQNALSEYLKTDESIQSSFNDYFDTFQDFIGGFDITKYKGVQGIVAVGSLVIGFFQIPYIDGIIQLSMFLGVIGFLLGVSYMISSFTVRNNYWKERNDYYKSRRK